MTWCKRGLNGTKTMEKRELCISKVFLFTFPTLVALHQNDADRDLGLLENETTHDEILSLRSSHVCV